MAKNKEAYSLNEVLYVSFQVREKLIRMITGWINGCFIICPSITELADFNR